MDTAPSEAAATPPVRRGLVDWAQSNGLLRLPRKRAMIGDIALGVAIFLLVGMPTGVQATPLLVVVLAAVSVMIRRLNPGIALGVTWVMVLLQMADSERPSFAQLAMVIVLYSVTAYGTRLEFWLATASAVVGGFVAFAYLVGNGTLSRAAYFVNSSFDAQQPSDLIVASIPFALLGSTWLLGLARRSAWANRQEAARREVAEDDASKALGLAHSEQARADMARDVHDVVGHSLAVIIAQADSVQFVDDPQAVRDVVATIARTARSSLVEVRGVLGRTEVTTDGVASDDLHAVIAQVRAAGVAVEETVRGTPRPLESDTAIVARRLLQEMLTNALRHGYPGGTIQVRIQWRTADVVLDVENPISPIPAVDTPGAGISGMRARLAKIGGHLEAEAIDGTFTVRARIPAHQEFPVQVGTRADLVRSDETRVPS